MLTKPNALALHKKLCSYPAAILSSKAGRSMIAKAIVLIRRLEGRDEARTFANLMVLARTV